MEQTVAEAVAAATQQQQAAAQQAQQLISQPSPPVQPVQNASSTIDNLTCQWQGCGERCDSAEALYVSQYPSRLVVAGCRLRIASNFSRVATAFLVANHIGC